MRRKALLLTVLLLAGAATIVMVLQKANDTRGGGRSATKVDEFDSILQDLLVMGHNDSRTNRLSERMKKMEAAQAKLRSLGTNILPRIMEEVRIVGRIETTNREAAINRTWRLARAFETLNGDAKPLLPMLIEEFRSGRSIGPSAAGIQAIGGTEAGLALVSGLTNSNSYIRGASLSSLGSFRTNAEVALAAVPLLLPLLEDEAQFARTMAANALGHFKTAPERVLPPLLKVVERDSDSVARRTAIKAIGRFGSEASSLAPTLETLAINDEDDYTRRAALIALQAVRGRIDPDRQHMSSEALLELQRDSRRRSETSNE